MSGERREQGIIAVLKQGFGFLRSVEREPKIYFTFNEVLEVQRKLECNDEVEFTVAQVLLFICKLILVTCYIKNGLFIIYFFSFKYLQFDFMQIILFAFLLCRILHLHLEIPDKVPYELNTYHEVQLNLKYLLKKN